MAFSNTASASTGKNKPLLNFWQIWNMSFGFLGVQIGYSLQNANTSRILSAIGADPHHLSLFWLAAPLAGFFVQPIVGLSSDKTWTRLGRRIPFILGGSIVSALAMFFMPNSEHFAQLLPPLFFGATMLLLMDTSFNVTMQPFRALVSDMVPDSQRNQGYSVQSFLINAGAVVGSILPFVLTWLGVANEPGPGEKVAPTVIWAFYFGGGALLLTVLWTSFRTKEYPPNEYAKYNNLEDAPAEKMSFIDLLRNIPSTMMQLAVTQFFSWFSLFLMWVYTTQGIAQNVWGNDDPKSAAFNEAGNWTGVIFAAYSVFAALFSLVLTPLANSFGRKNTYMLSLIAGGIGLA
ncbi:MAG: MFS transporter, partial [Chitinophagaceae bacterium]